MGQIVIENMEFYAFHGHYKEEQMVGNKFMVDCTIDTDLESASKSDNLVDALNYQIVYMIIKEEMEKKSYLLENIGGRILDALYSKMSGIKKVAIKIRKMNPPMGGKIGSVGIVMER